MAVDSPDQGRAETAGSDGALLAELAYLLRGHPEYRDRPISDFADFLAQLGLSEPAVGTVLRHLAQLSLADYPTGEELPIVVDWDLPPRCPIGWKPSVLFPVLPYWQHFEVSDGAPGALEIFFPTGRPVVPDRSLLVGCGQYPLVVLLHGHCRNAEPEHYKQWWAFAGRVARSGYIVVIPQTPNIANPFGGGVGHAEVVLNWIRSDWEHRDLLMPSPANAVIGHSNGAIIGAQLVSRLEVSAYVSLSGAWRDGYPEGPQILRELSVPSLFAWGTGYSATPDHLDGNAKPVFWDAIKPPKHKLVFNEGGHWDYISTSRLPCDNWTESGPCSLVPRVAADYTSLFLSRYLPPDGAGINGMIPATLMPPPVQRTAEQELAAVYHLSGLESLPLHPQCSVDHTYEIPELLIKQQSVNFGNVAVGQTAARLVEIENATGHHLALTFSTPEEPFGWLTHSIAVFDGQTRHISVEFKPQTTGTAETTLIVTPSTDSGPALEGAVKLSGRGVT